MKLKALIFLFAVFACGASSAEQQNTIGVHLGTYHSSNIYCDNGKNPGLYYSNGETGLTVGTYFNSCERQSYYIGWVSPTWHGLGVMAAGVTGYVRPVTPMIAPTFAVSLDKNTNVRVTGASWEGMDVYHISIERKF
jgi:hypothetical protein